MNSAIYAKKSGSSANSITARSHPLPYTRTEDVFLSALSTLLIAIAIVIGFAFVSAFYASFLVNERENSAKHQQVRIAVLCVCSTAVQAALWYLRSSVSETPCVCCRRCCPLVCVVDVVVCVSICGLQLVSGVSITAYWLSTFVWDILVYQVPCCRCRCASRVTIAPATIATCCMHGNQCQSCTSMSTVYPVITRLAPVFIVMNVMRWSVCVLCFPCRAHDCHFVGLRC